MTTLLQEPKKKQKIVDRFSSLNYSQSQYVGDDGNIFNQEEINQTLRNDRNPLAKSELDFNGSITKNELPLEINLENDKDGFPKKKLPIDSESFYSFKDVFVKCITEKGSTLGYNDLLAYICDEKDNFKIINYNNKYSELNGVKIIHSGDYT